MKRNTMVIVFLAIWAVIMMWLFPPRKWEDLTPEERLRHDIDATAIF